MIIFVVIPSPINRITAMRETSSGQSSVDGDRPFFAFLCGLISRTYQLATVVLLS